jgi:hypothetical protein
LNEFQKVDLVLIQHELQKKKAHKVVKATLGNFSNVHLQELFPQVLFLANKKTCFFWCSSWQKKQKKGKKNQFNFLK